MDTVLPKALEISLQGLLAHQNLTGWTIHGSNDMTTVVIRFKMEDTNCNLSTQEQTQRVKYKRSSPSQILRDNQRSQEWLAKQNSQPTVDVNMSIGPNSESAICKQQDTSVKESILPSSTRPKEHKHQSSPRVTRSKSSNQPKPSPMPLQVDGSTDNRRTDQCETADPWETCILVRIW